MLFDLKYAIRQLAKNRTFTVVVVLILALGIGANTAIFTVINEILLSSLPVKDPRELVFLTDPNDHGFRNGGGSGVRAALTYDEFRYLHDHRTPFSGLLAVSAQTFGVNATIEREGRSQRIGGTTVALVSGNYFATLGVSAVVGRMFGEEVDRTLDSSPVAVISYAYWQEKLAGDPHAVGYRLQIRGTSYDIVAVAPPQFFGETFGAPVEVWIPLTMQRELTPGHDYLSVEKNPFAKEMWLQVIGRRKPGIGLDQASIAANGTFQQYLKAQLAAVPEDQRREWLDQLLILTSGARGGSTLRQSYDAPLAILMVLVALLLLVSCANVGNLMLARATFRQREMAIRAAMGAGLGRIFRQVLTESLLLSLFGGGLGILLAHWGDLGLLHLVGGTHLDLRPDERILAFTLFVSMLVGIAFGLAPAFRSARVDLNGVLKNVIGDNGRRGSFSMGRILVVTQVSFSLLLLIVAGLFVRSLQNLAVANLGYDRSHLLVFNISHQATGHPDSATEAYYDKLRYRLGSIPGARGVSFSMLGLLNVNEGGTNVTIDGKASTPGQDMGANCEFVGPNYFATTRIPLLLGREITAEDERSGQRVGVINQTMARYFFGEANPLGRRIEMADDAFPRPYPAFVVVGVSADAKQHNAKEIPARRFYVPFFNSPFGPADGAQIEVRSAGNPTGIAAEIRSAMQEVDPHLPAVNVQSIDQIADRQLTVDQLLTKLSSCFGFLAAVLAATGIYGLMSYTVARRNREVGIRMALGARPERVLRMILGESLVLVGLGAIVGVLASLGAGRLLNTLLYNMGLADPVMLIVMTLAMLVIAMVAAFTPAWRASRVNPAIVLRDE